MLQQLTTRFHGMRVELPDDAANTAKTRELVCAALRARMADTSKGARDMTQEEGVLV